MCKVRKKASFVLKVFSVIAKLDNRSFIENEEKFKKKVNDLIRNNIRGIY